VVLDDQQSIASCMGIWMLQEMVEWFTFGRSIGSNVFCVYDNELLRVGNNLNILTPILHNEREQNQTLPLFRSWKINCRIRLSQSRMPCVFSIILPEARKQKESYGDVFQERIIFFFY